MSFALDRPKAPPRARPPVAHLGGHRLARVLLLTDCLLLALSVFGFWITGLTYRSGPEKIAILAVVLLVWVAHVLQPGRKPADWAIADSLMALLLMLIFTNFASPLQYVAVALKAPLVDRQLASADRLLGVDLPSIVDWTRARPWLADALVFSYRSLLAEFFLPVLVIGLWYREQRTLWEYVFHFYFCGIVTVACLTVWPAICPPAYYGLTPLIDMTRVIAQIRGFHDGSMTTIRVADVDGLVSIPSFHAAGAVMVTWAFRKHTRWLCVLVPVNALMIASTVMTGAHYAVDVLATFVLFAASLGIYCRSSLAHWHEA